MSRHRASIAARMAPPKDLLAWYLAEYRDELPERLHGRGVWADRATEHEREAGIRPTGGSLLGTPAYAEGFRRLLEDHPKAIEYAEHDGQRTSEGHYRTPLRAALADLAGHRRSEADFPFMARFLYRLAYLDGDWQRAASSLGVRREVARVYMHAALYQLWRRYSVIPYERSVA